jgi:hypothetical protein
MVVCEDLIVGAIFRMKELVGIQIDTGGALNDINELSFMLINRRSFNDAG